MIRSTVSDQRGAMEAFLKGGAVFKRQSPTQQQSDATPKYAVCILYILLTLA